MAIEIKQFVANISDLIPTSNNPRQINKNDFEKLKKSLREFPEMRSIREIVVDENMVILGGHQRAKALMAIGETTVPCKQVFGLTPNQKKEFVIKDNIANGEWDMDILANEWDDLPLDDWGLDLKFDKLEMPDDLDADDSDNDGGIYVKISFKDQSDADAFLDQSRQLVQSCNGSIMVHGGLM